MALLCPPMIAINDSEYYIFPVQFKSDTSKTLTVMNTYGRL